MTAPEPISDPTLADLLDELVELTLEGVYAAVPLAQQDNFGNSKSIAALCQTILARFDQRTDSVTINREDADRLLTLLSMPSMERAKSWDRLQAALTTATPAAPSGDA